MKYIGKYTDNDRLVLIDIIIRNNHLDYLEDFLSDTLESFASYKKEKKKDVMINFLMLLPDHIIAEIYSFGLGEDGVRITIYEFIDENIENLNRSFN